jgi:hypothetical protein
MDAFPLPCPYRYVLFDRDRKFSGSAGELLKASGIKAVRTSVRSPWQNGVAERWVGSIRPELLYHVIPLNEATLSSARGGSDIRYYHEDRTHIGLNKQTPGVRPVESRPIGSSIIVGTPGLGGLHHHRYAWSAVA